MILVDTNILLDIATGDPIWGPRSLERLSTAIFEGQICINSVIYAEFSLAFDSIEACDSELEKFGIRLLEMPRQALFRAGRAFRDYRRRGGARTGVLPDFFIGAHAEVIDAMLLTRDTGRYEMYFPEVRLVRP